MVKKLKMMMVCLVFLVVILVGGLFYLNNTITGNTVQDEQYKIGVIAPLTGIGSELGQPFTQGMQLGVDEVNAKGGVGGKNVKLIVQDSKLNAKTSVDAANYLINVEQPDIVSVLFHLPAIATNELFKQAKIPMIYEAYTRSIGEENEYAFKANYDALTGCEQLTNHLKVNGKYDKLGVMFAKAEYSDLCLEGIKEVEEDVEEYWYNFGETDFRTLFTKINNDEVDIVVTIGLGFEFMNMFKQLSELGYDTNIVCASTATECISPEIIAQSTSEVLEGVVSIDFVSPKIANTKLKQMFDGETVIDNIYAAVGYEEVMIMTEAMQECNVGDEVCLVNALEEVKDYDSVIDSNGFKDRVLQLNTDVYEFRNGEWVLV